MAAMLSSSEIRSLVEKEISQIAVSANTQDLIDSGIFNRLKGYVVKPGKVSDSIFGGYGSFYDKVKSKLVEFENPPLKDKNGCDLRIMIRSSRISTHDFNRGEIPFKDQILASNHNFMRKLVQQFIGSSQIEIPGLADTSLVTVAENLQQLGYENVLRAYNAKSSTSTSLYQSYIKGIRDFCGHKIPEGIIPNGPLPYVMDTPTTKSDLHDEIITPAELIANGSCTTSQYKQVLNGSLVAFGAVANFLAAKGLIAVDTKTEHGINSRGEVVAQDEIWTIDSSRFWLKDDYDVQFGLYTAGQERELEDYLKNTQVGITEKDYLVDGKVTICPRSYSKEFARGFSKGEDLYQDSERAEIAIRYVESIQYLLGTGFKPETGTREQRIEAALKTALKYID